MSKLEKKQCNRCKLGIGDAESYYLCTQHNRYCHIECSTESATEYFQRQNKSNYKDCRLQLQRIIPTTDSVCDPCNDGDHSWHEQNPHEEKRCLVTIDQVNNVQCVCTLDDHGSVKYR